MFRGVIFSFSVGLAGLVISLFFSYVGIVGGQALGETPPVFVRAIMLMFGLPFGFISLLAMKHAASQAWVRACSSPINVNVAVREVSDSDATTYELHVRHGDKRWIAPAYGGRGIKLILDEGPIVGEAWCDTRNGNPLSVKVGDYWITTYPRIISASATNCLV